MSLYTYCPEDVSILIMGVPLIGVIEGTFITLEREAPLYQSTSTTDGRVVRTYIPHDIYTLRITLMNGSPSNDFLHRLSLADRITRRGKFPMMVKDNLGSTLAFSTESWIEEQPIVDFSTEMTEREWVIKSANTTMHIGGNDGATGMMEDALNTIVGSVAGML